MTRQNLRLMVSVPGLLMLIAIGTFADDSVKPERVLTTEHALSTKQAQSVQKSWADHLGVDAITTNSIGMQLCLIPPGTFPMGNDYGKGWRGQKVVTHSQPFFIGRHEVTRGEWERLMGSFHGQPKVGVGDRFPRNGVDYAEAAEFCRKLTLLVREAGKLPEGYEYRLPTNAESEYAGRAGTLTLTYFGDKLSSRQANFDGAQPLNGAERGPNLGRSAEVGSYPANAWGLHDTLGNVAEWCLDWYHVEPMGGVDPVQWLPPPERLIPQRVIRGGYHSRAGGYCRSASRYRRLPEDGSGNVGFRLVLSKLQLDGLDELTDSRHTDFDQAWTRDGTNWRVWNRRNPKVAGYHVMLGNIDHIPGEKFAVGVSDKSHHTWAHTCLTDGRILVRSNPSNHELGYYFMTPSEDGSPKYERIQCDLATKGILDRISLSPSETRICFEFQTADTRPVGGSSPTKQTGSESDIPGRTLYVADFNAKKLTITGAEPFANEDGKPIWYAFPRWTEDESAIVYQADGTLYRYNLADGSTTKVSTIDPHVKRAPK